MKKLLLILLLLMPSLLMADTGYQVYQDTTTIADASATNDVTMATISDLSRAFVIVHYSYCHFNTDTEVQQDEGRVSAYLWDDGGTSKIRFTRDDTNGTIWISYTVIECFDEEFTVYRGDQNWSSTTTDYYDSITTAVDSNLCLAWVNGTTTDDTGNDLLRESSFIASVVHSDSIKLERYYLSGSSAGKLRWIVVEFDTSKIGGIERGSQVVTTEIESAPILIATALDYDQSIVLAQWKTSGDEGLNGNAIAVNMISDGAGDSVIAYVSANNDYNRVLRYHVIDFGGDVVSKQSGKIDSTDNSNWTDCNITPSPSVDYERTWTFATLTCGGGGSAFPRHAVRHWIDDGGNLNIERDYDGQYSDIEWQIIELPYVATPLYPKVTTWYTETYDSEGYGEINPDPDVSAEGLVTWRPKFSVESPIDNVDSVAIDVFEDSTGSDTIWAVGWQSIAETDSGNRTPKIVFPDCDTNDVRWRIPIGEECHWRIKLMDAGTDTTAWTAWQTFTGVAPIEWWDSDYRKREIIFLDNDHDELDQGTQLKVPLQTGYARIMADNLPRDGEGRFALFGNWMYMVWGGYSNTFYWKGLSLFIKKYNIVTEDTSSTHEFFYFMGDNHTVPEIAITEDTILHIIISAHHDSARYMQIDSFSTDDSSFVITEVTGGWGRATAAGTDSTLIDTLNPWIDDELIGYAVTIFHPSSGAKETKHIYDNDDSLIYVTSDWGTNPIDSSYYFIHYKPPALADHTYPWLVPFRDSLYVFFRHTMTGSGTDDEYENSTASGTHTDSTLEDDAQSWADSIWTGYQLTNITTAEGVYVTGNIGNVLYVSPKWVDTPDDDDEYLLRRNSGGDRGIYSYTLYDPHADSINVAWLARQNVINYLDPYQHSQFGGSCYGSVFHHDATSNDRIHLICTFRDRYGEATGRGLTYMYSDLDGGLFATWRKINGDTIGFTFTDLYYHPNDSTIDYGNCDIIAEAGDNVTTNLLTGSNLSNHVLADTLHNPIISFSTHADTLSGLGTGPFYVAQWTGSDWAIDSLSVAESDTAINGRTAGSMYLHGNDKYVYTMVWQDSITLLNSQYFGGEVKRWVGTGQPGSMAWSSDFLTKFSGHSVGRIWLLPRVYDDGNRWITYSRGTLLYLMKDRSSSIWRTDGEDIRIVTSSIDSVGIGGDSVDYIEHDRVPDNSWQETDGNVVFALKSTSAIPADQRSYSNRTIEYYYDKMLATDQPVDIGGDGGATDIYRYYYSFEGAFTPPLAPYAPWNDHGDSIMIFGYRVGWIYCVWSGKNYVYMEDDSFCSMSLSAYNMSNWMVLSVYIYPLRDLATSDDSMWVELEGDNNQKFRVGVADIGTDSIIYNIGDGWVASDSANILRYAEARFLIGDSTNKNLNSDLWIYYDDKLIAVDTTVAEIEGDAVVTAGGDELSDRVVNSGGNWSADELNGYYVKVTSGPTSGDIRLIDDTAEDTLFITPNFTNPITEGSHYTVYDSSGGIKLYPDSIHIRTTDGTVGYFDVVSLYETVENSSVLTTSSRQALSTEARRRKQIILGGMR